MGILKDAIREVLTQSAKEQGRDIRFIDSPTRVIETSEQAKYNDIRRVERGYVQGVHKARKEAQCTYGARYGSSYFCSYRCRPFNNNKSKCANYHAKNDTQKNG